MFTVLLGAVMLFGIQQLPSSTAKMLYICVKP